MYFYFDSRPLMKTFNRRLYHTYFTMEKELKIYTIERLRVKVKKRHISSAKTASLTGTSVGLKSKG